MSRNKYSLRKQLLEDRETFRDPILKSDITLDDEGPEDNASLPEHTSEREAFIEKVKKMKPTDVIKLIASNDDDLYNYIEKGTAPYRLWVKTLRELDVNDVISSKQSLNNIKKLKKYALSLKLDTPHLNDDEESSEDTTNILDNKQIQTLLCDATRNFIRNIKQEFGNVLLAFTNRLVGVVEALGYNNPVRGAFYLVDDNSSEVCSAFIGALSEFTENTPSTVGVKIEKNTNDRRSLGLKYGVSSILLNDLVKIFDEETILNPEQVITVDDNLNEVVDVASAINLSDLIHVNKTRKLASEGCYSIYTAFRMQKGGYSSNFNFGMQIIPVSDSSFNVVYYLYLANNVTKPNGQLNCSNWI